MAETASIEELQDLVVAQRGALIAALGLMHSLAPDEYLPMLRMHRLLAQSVEEGRFGSNDPRIARIHGLVRDILEEGAKRSECPDPSGE